MKHIALIAVAALTLTACASRPDKLMAASVSPLQYKTYDCEQTVQELDRVSLRYTELHNTLDKKAANDEVQMIVGMLAFWPALFFLEGGDGAEAVEYSRLKGEKDTLEKTVIANGCAATVAKSE